MSNNFVGVIYRLADNWFNHINMIFYNKPINYLGERNSQVFIKNI